MSKPMCVSKFISSRIKKGAGRIFVYYVIMNRYKAGVSAFFFSVKPDTGQGPQDEDLTASVVMKLQRGR